MRQLQILVLIILFSTSTAHSVFANGILTIDNLRIEYHENPSGIDVEKPRFSWILKGEGRNLSQSAYQIVVSSDIQKLNAGDWDIWDSGKVNSNSTNQIEYNGSELQSNSDYYWKVRVWDEYGKEVSWSSSANWSVGLLNFSEWKGFFISHNVGYDKTDKYDDLYLPPARYLRKSFYIDKKVKKAKVYATALGLYELRLNGDKVGDDYFAPGWTDYNKRLYYQTFDITNEIKQGDNAVGAVIADGWYAGYVGYGLLVRLDKVREFYGVNPAFMGQIQIEYEDGTTEIIASDLTWKANEGPIREADILMGETYDARLEQTGWDSPNFDDSEWKSPKLYTYPGGALDVHPGGLVKSIEELKTKTITEPEIGKYIFDLGKNIAGIARLKLQGKRGQKITIRYGEILNDDGSLLTENLRLARATDTYILKGEGVETWQPKFTYHGFQFVEVSGLTEKPDLDVITGIVMSSIETDKSTFSSSNELNNILYQNIKTTQKANYFDVPTDCPQRDERLGWTGDAQTFMRSGTYMANMAPFMTKYLTDLDDAQQWYGVYPNFAPFPYSRPDQYAPAWMDAGVIMPYNMYKVYNDTRILEYMYPGMQKFMDFQLDASTNFIRPEASANWGDWLSVNEETSKGYVAAAFYGYDAKLMIEIAKALGKEEDVIKYTKLYENIKMAFAKKYLLDNGFTTEDTQTTYALALYFDLYPSKELAKNGAKRLVQKIKENGYLFSTGFIGTKHIMPSLSKYGYHDTAYKLFQQTKYPSWGYSIENGSTSIWERWNSYTKDKEQNSTINAAMNSFSHYAFGSVAEWMFQYALGIDSEDSGYRNILIKPAVSKEMGSMEGSYDCINGKISSGWKWKGSKLTLDVSIPANTQAKVFIPSSKPSSIKEGKLRLNKVDGIKILESGEEEVVVQIGSGDYTFTTTIK